MLTFKTLMGCVVGLLAADRSACLTHGSPYYFGMGFSCAAKHPGTVRLCPCADVNVVEIPELRDPDLEGR